ncbi:MAG: hypothetical protein Q4G39_10100 [Brachymonas sp.]|nr:hypothetical protein [Brachymonas sp.]
MQKLQLRTLPYGKPAEIHAASDVEHLNFSAQVLDIRIACARKEKGSIQGLDISFSEASAFRCLDESDLARYWRSEGFVRSYPVLEGGWCDEEAALQGYKNHRREWLVITGNTCVNIFAATNPTIAAADWEYKE